MAFFLSFLCHLVRFDLFDSRLWITVYTFCCDEEFSFGFFVSHVSVVLLIYWASWKVCFITILNNIYNRGSSSQIPLNIQYLTSIVYHHVNLMEFWNWKTVPDDRPTDRVTKNKEQKGPKANKRAFGCGIWWTRSNLIIFLFPTKKRLLQIQWVAVRVCFDKATTFFEYTMEPCRIKCYCAYFRPLSSITLKKTDNQKTRRFVRKKGVMQIFETVEFFSQ